MREPLCYPVSNYIYAQYNILYKKKRILILQ